jgi:ABC-type nitrate/sulfonate/bicarbonate transport system permease component
MSDLVLIVAGPAIGAAVGLVVGILIGRWSNVERQVDARLARELAPPPAPRWRRQ